MRSQPLCLLVVMLMRFKDNFVLSTENPTLSPSSTMRPSSIPTPSPTSLPSGQPSPLPFPVPTPLPTSTPTILPSSLPTQPPTMEPSFVPSITRTAAPTSVPTTATDVPSGSPTNQPTLPPTPSPTVSPSIKPSSTPTISPLPSALPSLAPTPAPTELPTAAPTPLPSGLPSAAPTSVPSASPTPVPTRGPSASPSLHPIPRPTRDPTHSPTLAPSPRPSPSPTGLAVPSPAPTKPKAAYAPDALHRIFGGFNPMHVFGAVLGFVACVVSLNRAKASIADYQARYRRHHGTDDDDDDDDDEDVRKATESALRMRRSASLYGGKGKEGSGEAVSERRRHSRRSRKVGSRKARRDSWNAALGGRISGRRDSEHDGDWDDNEDAPVTRTRRWSLKDVISRHPSHHGQWIHDFDAATEEERKKESLPEGQAFLNNVGLGIFYPKFEENAIFTVEDLCDASLISDKELVTEIGFNAEQVTTFRQAVTRRNNAGRHRPVRQVQRGLQGITAGASAVQAARGVVNGVDQRRTIGVEPSKSLRRAVKEAETKRRRKELRKTERRLAERRKAIQILDARAVARESNEQQRQLERRGQAALERRANDHLEDQGAEDGGARQNSAEEALQKSTALDGIFGTLDISTHLETVSNVPTTAADIGASAVSAALNSASSLKNGLQSGPESTLAAFAAEGSNALKYGRIRSVAI